MWGGVRLRKTACMQPAGRAGGLPQRRRSAGRVRTQSMARTSAPRPDTRGRATSGDARPLLDYIHTTILGNRWSSSALPRQGRIALRGTTGSAGKRHSSGSSCTIRRPHGRLPPGLSIGRAAATRSPRRRRQASSRAQTTDRSPQGRSQSTRATRRAMQAPRRRPRSFRPRRAERPNGSRVVATPNGKAVLHDFSGRRSPDNDTARPA